ncbi:putative ribonuclease H-like domain-containing protein [Tanacetum coccineum]
MDIKWKMAMLSVRVNKLEKKAGRKIEFDKKKAARFNKKAVRCYKCLQKGHFARECRAKGGNEKRYSSFKIQELGKKEADTKALITVDTLENWKEHESGDDKGFAPKEYGMVAGCDAACEEGAAEVYNLITGNGTDVAAGEFALMGMTSEVQAYKNSLKTLEKQKRVYQQNQLGYEEKIRVLSIELENTTNLLKHSERINVEAEIAKKDLQTKLDNHLAKTEKWTSSSKNLLRLIDSSMSVRTKVGLGFNDYIGENELGWDDSAFSVFTTNSEEVEGRPLFSRFAKVDSMKAVPPPLSGDYTPLSDHIDLDESQMSYGIKSSTSGDSNSMSNDFVSCDNSDKSSDVNINDFASSDSSVISSEPKSKDSTFYESTSSVSTSESEAEIESNVGTPIQEPIIVQDLPSFSCNSSDKNETLLGLLVIRMTQYANDFDGVGYPQREPIWDNATRATKTNQFVPQAVRLGSGKVSIPAARPNQGPAGRPKPVSTGRPKPVSTGAPVSNVTSGWWQSTARPMNHLSTPTSSYFQTPTPFRPHVFYNQMQYNGDGWATTVKPSAGCSWKSYRNKVYRVNLHTDAGDERIVDSGCGKVTFGGDEGRITRKGTIRTPKLDFENVYYVKELQQFNLFSVSQICDKTNRVLFTDTDCLVLSNDFKLPDESMVLLRVPRKHNLYTFNLNTIAPKENMACLMAKASSNEVVKWHRRMGHVNYKNMNKLVKDNLVRGLPLKLFKNDHTCVACCKGKQHKATYKAITAVSSISEPLKLLHIDLFGPTSIRSIDRKYYCLVINDDYSRFCWVFFLETKDETYPLLKDFISLVENQLNKKVKEAARTMLADSKLPTMFWTEVVRTACYVLNRVLIINPHNKTPYALLTGKTPSISYFKPFGCHVTILNTNDHLGKFDGKADEGYLVGYSGSNRAYRVYNMANKRVEETMNLRFLEEKANIQGIGHEWSFDLDYLTDSLGYNRDKANQSAGTQDVFSNPAGFQDDNSNSNSDEQVILELARLKDHEQRATSDAERLGLGFAKANEELQKRASAKIVPPGSIPVPTRRIPVSPGDVSVPTGGVPVPTVEPRSVAQALEDPSWVDAMQEEIQQFKFQNVWVLVDLPEDKYAIGTKQEEVIDYDEVFDPVAIIEAIRLFLAFASYLGFMVYQMDVKSAFLYGRIDEEVYVTQPKGFLDPQHPKKVYKHKRDITLVQVYVDDIIFGSTKKAWCDEFEALMKGEFEMSAMGELTFFLGLQVQQRPDEIFINQDKYVQEILKKFNLKCVRTATTPYEAPKPKSKNKPDSPVNVHLYRSMIASLMYLTASRPDIMFAVSACSRFQVTPTT